MTRPLQLDFAAQSGPLRALGIALLLAGAAAMLWIGRAYLASSEELADWDTKWRALQGQRGSAVPATGESAKRFDTEIAFANRTIGRLSLPWDRLFLEVEVSVDEHVTLLSVEPDVDKGELRIAAEARNLAAMLAYAKRLRASTLLKDAHVQSHQLQLQRAERPVRFTVQARWLAAPAQPEAAPPPFSVPADK